MRATDSAMNRSAEHPSPALRAPTPVRRVVRSAARAHFSSLARIVSRAGSGVLCLLGALNANGQTPAPAPAATNAPPPITVRQEREVVPGMDPIYRIYVTAGTNRFALLTPNGFRASADPQAGVVTLSHAAGGCNLRFQLGGPMPADAKELKAEMLREPLLARYPGARVLDEFTVTAAGHSGPAFDLNWPAPSGLPLFIRAAFVPSDAGILEFTMTTSPAKARESHPVFNAFLLTFRASQGGKLEVTPLSNKL